MSTTAYVETMLDILEGLVPLRQLRLRKPDESARALGNALELAWSVAELGDRLTAPENFGGKKGHAERSMALNAMATALALGSLQHGGVTWCGRHWCTAEHPDCPNRRS